LERGFFSAASYKEYQEKAKALIKQNVISKDDLKDARVERYIIGPVFNFNFFYSPLGDRKEPIELLGVDWRFETSLDGHVRLPAEQQMRLLKAQKDPEYVVCGHNSATVRESLLEKAFPLAEKFVKATKEHFPPGIIGPFCLQTCVDKDLNFYIYDVAPRIGGGTNIHMAVGHPYGNTLWRTNMSTGRRIAREIRRAVELDRLEKIVT
jgi:5-formaminoimidazole-4-carboxamide-1-(beta)-D-ribofuranosyl 5'-monophosphate synthetase